MGGGGKVYAFGDDTPMKDAGEVALEDMAEADSSGMSYSWPSFEAYGDSRSVGKDPERRL